VCHSRRGYVLGWQPVLSKARLSNYVVVGQAHLVEAAGSLHSHHIQVEEWMTVRAVENQLERTRFVLVVAA
jgi:hypothetical protein